MPFINASSVVNCASSCDGFVWFVGTASLIPGLVSRVVSQVAFFPPRPAGIHVAQDKKVLLVGPGLELTPLPDLSASGITIDTVRMWTRRQNTIHGFHFQRADSNGTILFSHGNSTDIGLMFDHMAELCFELRMDVFAYDYSGYGASTGVPTEADLSADIDTARQYLSHDCCIPDSSIFLMGQSIGSVPTIDLATRHAVGGVILQSALKSGLSMFHDVKDTYWFDVFKNVERIQRVKAPVFIMHGTHDLEVPFHHAVALLDACPDELSFDPWWVKEAGHNDIQTTNRNEYFIRLRHFVEDVRKRQPLKNKKGPQEDGFAHI